MWHVISINNNDYFNYSFKKYENSKLKEKYWKIGRNFLPVRKIWKIYGEAKYFFDPCRSGTRDSSWGRLKANLSKKKSKEI